MLLGGFVRDVGSGLEEVTFVGNTSSAAGEDVPLPGVTDCARLVLFVYLRLSLASGADVGAFFAEVEVGAGVCAGDLASRFAADSRLSRGGRTRFCGVWSGIAFPHYYISRRRVLMLRREREVRKCFRVQCQTTLYLSICKAALAQ